MDNSKSAGKQPEITKKGEEMTKEQIVEQLIREYEKLLKEKERLKNETERNKKDIKKKADELAHAISDADMKSGYLDGYTYTPAVTHKYYLMGAGKADAAGVDRFAPFENDPLLADLVHKDINWRSMQKPLQKMEEDGLLTDELLEVLTIQDEFGITRRKTDTSGKDKVAAAIAKKREEKKNV